MLMAPIDVYKRQLFNSFIALVKETSLAAHITIPEMFLTTQRITASNYEPLLMYIEVGFIYLIFCTVLNYVQNRIENKLMPVSYTHLVSNFYSYITGKLHLPHLLQVSVTKCDLFSNGL